MIEARRARGVTATVLGVVAALDSAVVISQGRLWLGLLLAGMCGVFFTVAWFSRRVTP